MTKREIVARVVMCGLMIAAVLLCLAAVGVRSEGGATEAVLAYNGSNLIRLHVVAPGDDGASQRLKLAVRDAVLKVSNEVIGDAGDSREALARLTPKLDLIRQHALDAVAAAGADLPVAVSLGRYPFPTVAYGRSVLPSGDYTAIRVSIGSGTGANWWCVLFPPLCMVDIDRARIIEVSSTGDDRIDHSVRVQFALGLSAPNLSAAQREAAMYQAGLMKPGPSVAEFSWNLPQWVARILRMPDSQQARK